MASGSFTSYGSVSTSSNAMESPVAPDDRDQAARHAGQMIIQGLPPTSQPYTQQPHQHHQPYGQSYPPPPHGRTPHSYPPAYGQVPPNPGYNTFHPPYRVPSSTSISMMSTDSLSLSGSYQEQQSKACCAPMSPVRRTFCLLLLFDFILAFILWVIYSQQVMNKNLFDALKEDVQHYTFKYSMFDTVMCSAWRFVPLLLAYGLFRISNPWVIAMTTTGTCVFLLCKVFLFHINEPSNDTNTICYVLLIASFILTWVETWFLDFKVLPREQKDRERAQFIRRFNEHTPLMGGHLTGQASNEHFYSPHHSDDDDDEFKSLPGSRGQSRGHSRTGSGDQHALPAQERQYLDRAKDAWRRAFEIHDTESGWKMETGRGQVDGIVYSQTFRGIPKVYRLTGLVHCAPHILYTQLVLRITETPQWSPTTLGVEILQQVTDNCDVIHHIAAEAGGGLVSSRDFVSVRLWDKKDDCYASAALSVEHPHAPKQKHHVRGANGPGLFVFLPVENKPDECLLVMYVSTDLKGWLPQSLVDRALGGVLMDYLKDVRKHVATLKHQRRKNARR